MNLGFSVFGFVGGIGVLLPMREDMNMFNASGVYEIGRRLFLEFRADRVYALSNIEGSSAMTLREIRETIE